MNSLLGEALKTTNHRVLMRHRAEDHEDADHASHASHADHDSHVEEEEHDSHAGEGEEGGEGMSLTTFKFILLIFMFLEVYLGLIPKKVDWCTKSQLPLSFLNCFASGIFLAMAVVHILPESAEIWAAW